MEPATSTAIIAEFAKHGILGAVILALGVVAIALYRGYLKSHEDRIADTKDFQSKYIGVIDKQNEASSDVNLTLTLIKERLPK
jgi:hypothetical protein